MSFVCDSSSTHPTSIRVEAIAPLVAQCCGVSHRRAVQVLTALLGGSYQPLRLLRHLQVEQLAETGLTPAQQQRLVGAIALGRQLFLEAAVHLPPIDNKLNAHAYFLPYLSYQFVERFAVLVLDLRHSPLALEVVAQGTDRECLADPKSIFGMVLKHRGSRCIVAHNHPSGQVEPSPDDLSLTRHLLKASQVMGIPVLDHLIIGGQNYTSLRSTTALWKEHSCSGE